MRRQGRINDIPRLRRNIKNRVRFGDTLSYGFVSFFYLNFSDLLKKLKIAEKVKKVKYFIYKEIITKNC